MTAGAAAAPPRVICLGLTAFDVTWTVQHLPAGDGKTRAMDLQEGGGGMAATAAVAVARLGGRAAFWGRAGDDRAGQAMREELAGHGVDVSGLRCFAGGRSSVSGILVDGAGQRMIVNFRGADLPDSADWLPLQAPLDADAVLADPRWPQGALALFQAARQQGVVSVLDADMADAAVFDQLLPWTDYAVFSEPALAAYSGQTDAEAGLRHALARGCRVAAVTRGADGALWLDPHEHPQAGLQRQPAFPVPVVDTTGAGDVFHGALAYALGAGWPTAEAFRFSAAVAALKCQRAGGRAGCPDLATARSLLDLS